MAAAMVRIGASLVVIIDFLGVALVAGLQLHEPWTAVASVAVGAYVLTLVNVLCSLRPR